MTIANAGEAQGQLCEVLDRKLEWFEALEKANARARRIHPLIVRVDLPDDRMAALSGTARDVLAFARRIYGPADVPCGTNLDRLCEEIAGELTSYPNITPGGVFQTRPFFARTMQAFQDAWRDSVLWATHGQPVSSAQRFTNLRIVPGNGPSEKDRRPYATTTIHSDIWIGEPIDSVNGWAALCGDLENTVIQFYDCSPGFLASHFGHEPRYDTVLTKLEAAGVTFSPIDEKIAPGALYLFDCLVPHRTCRGTGGVRLSIDGRLRTGILDTLETAGPLPLNGRAELRCQYLEV